MTRPPQHEPFEVLARRIDPGSTLIRTWDLKGGVSAQVTAFEIAYDDGRIEKLVVRRHGAADLRRNPSIAAGEFRLLQLLESEGVSAPRARYLDPRGDLFGVPCLVVDYIEGEPARHPSDAAGFVEQFAAALTEIHRVEHANASLSFLPERVAPDGTAPRRNRPALLHGDFWPGNTLWRDGRLVGIIDWEDAAVGDPVADVANARLELVWALGFDAADEFTHRYASATAVDLADLPHWDLWADRRLSGSIGEWGLDDATEAAMRTAREAFASNALEKLAER